MDVYKQLIIHELKYRDHSISTLVKATSISKRTVQKHVRELLSIGLIEIDRKNGLIQFWEVLESTEYEVLPTPPPLPLPPLRRSFFTLLEIKQSLRKNVS